MKERLAFSMTRPIDSLGRIVIPKETRTLLGWNEKDNIFIGERDGIVFLKKFDSICPVCKNPFDNLSGKKICDNCVEEFKK